MTQQVRRAATVTTIVALSVLAGIASASAAGPRPGPVGEAPADGGTGVLEAPVDPGAAAAGTPWMYLVLIVAVLAAFAAVALWQVRRSHHATGHPA